MIWRLCETQSILKEKEPPVLTPGSRKRMSFITSLQKGECAILGIKATLRLTQGGLFQRLVLLSPKLVTEDADIEPGGIIVTDVENQCPSLGLLML